MISRSFLFGKIALVVIAVSFFGWWYFDLGARINSIVFVPALQNQKSVQSQMRSTVYQTYDINGKILKVETVSDPDGIRQGLSDRLMMEDDTGMLFLMPVTDLHPFWMNRMQFALDMIWLLDGVVVEIAPNMPPPSFTGDIPATHFPKAKANQILELSAGGVERYGIKVGDKLDF